MNAESIERWLVEVGVPAEVISVGTERDSAWCLLGDGTPDADGVRAWEVFWREQGNRYDWARFDSEHVACHYLFGRLVWAQVARGAVGVVDSVDTGRHELAGQVAGGQESPDNTQGPAGADGAADTGRHPVATAVDDVGEADTGRHAALPGPAADDEDTGRHPVRSLGLPH